MATFSTLSPGSAYPNPECWRLAPRNSPVQNSNSVTFEDLRPETKFDHVLLVRGVSRFAGLFSGLLGRGERRTAMPLVLQEVYLRLGNQLSRSMEPRSSRVGWRQTPRAASSSSVRRFAAAVWT
jgi:hypothetical protein